MPRRDFFEKGGQLAAGATLVPGWDWETSAHETEPGTLRVALIGTGNRGPSMWGRDLVSPYAESLTMVGLCDINSKRVEAGRESFRV